MQLSLQNFASIVQNAAAAVQSASAQLLDLTVGSVLRAILEANASIALWMQWLILQVLQSTRAATSSGGDLDSWMADFSLSRLPASASSGKVTFSRFTPTLGTLIPVGASVRTADGNQTFSVIADATIPTFSPSQNGYVVGKGVTSIDVPVQSTTAGAAANIQAGSAVRLGTAIPGVDSVTNALPFQNGLDAETDINFRTRFVNYINSRSRATTLAVGNAVESIKQGLQYVVQENQDTSGAWRPGSFVVTVDDGSGLPSDTLLTTVAGAIEAVRPVGSQFAIQPPAITKADISLTITVHPSAQKAPVVAIVAAAVTTYVASLPIGAALPLTRIAQVAYAAHSAVINVSQIKVNGTASDVNPPPFGVVKPGIISIN